MAMDGLQQIGRDFFGVFPARGKFINARNASKEQLAGNAEHNALKEIMGFREGADYEDDKMFATLRYGSIMMMTDQDVDGYHIKGLFYNWIIKTWPSLLKRKGFFKCFVTPIVRLQPTSKASRKQAKLFFNMGEYEAYRAAHGTAGMSVRYLKGLGTSEKQEAREYFADYNRFVKEYHSFDDQVTMEQFDHAFSDKFADWRKEWLGRYDENDLYDYKAPVFKLDDYIDKELKHFSIYDNKRSIGHCMDGLKVSQRKVLWGIRKLGYWNTTKKVLALAGDVSSLSSYHHGEKSLMDTIVGMAQDFVDSNNLNLLYPSGQFGSRLQQGNDASDPRYIFTRLNPITQYLFRSEDDKVLKYEQDDEGKSIEPRHFSPIIPIVLVNGCQGIGTGYSTTVPMYNPLDIIDQYVAKLSGAATDTEGNLIPWYNGFKGTIVPVPDQPGLFDSIGCYNRIDDTTLDVTEVPVGQSFDGYKAFLEDHLAANMNVGTEKQTEAKKAAAQLKHFLADYENMSFPTSCHFRLTFSDKSVLDEMLADPKAPKGILKRLRLVCRLSTRNMYLFGVDGAIKKFESPEEIMSYHSRERLELYSTRKQYQLEELDEQIAMLTQKQRFIQLVLSGDIDVRNKSKQLIAEAIRAHNIVTDEPGGEGEDDADEASEAVLTPQMKMLLKISLFDITEEEVAKFMNKIAALRVERDTLANTPPEHIWLSELNELRDAVVSHFDALASSQSDDGVKAVKAKAKAVKAKAKAKAK
jgi:DNA topoisomerase-2